MVQTTLNLARTAYESSGLTYWRDRLHWTDSFGRLTPLVRFERKKGACFKLESGSNSYGTNKNKVTRQMDGQKLTIIAITDDRSPNRVHGLCSSPYLPPLNQKPHGEGIPAQIRITSTRSSPRCETAPISRPRQPLVSYLHAFLNNEPPPPRDLVS